MVLNVCRSVLRHEHDAEDAFQAAFLVLARKAESIRRPQAVASWLCEVAYHVAVKAQTDTARRRAQERRASPMASHSSPKKGTGPLKSQVPSPFSEADPTLDMTMRDLQRVLHEELQRLPDKYRLPLVLCYLEDLSHEEAARQLGWTKGTFRGRLDRGREHLRRRLTRRGLALSTVLCAVGLSLKASPATAALMDSVVRAALLSSVGQAVSGVVSAKASALAEGVTRAMFATKIKIATAVLVAVGLIAGAGALTCQTLAAKEAPTQAAKDDAKSVAKEDGKPKAPARKDDTKDVVEVSGRVLGPDGKFISGAKLYWPRYLKEHPEGAKDMTWVQGAATGTDGRFQFKLAKKEFRAGRPVPLIALADGLGADWTQVSKADKPAALTLHLVKDLPIRGRLLDTQGKPLAGVRVSVHGLFTTPEGNVDKFLTTWKQLWHDGLGVMKKQVWMPLDKVLPTATTDKAGRFQLTGVGGERLVFVGVKGAALASDTLYVVARAGFDAKPINDAALDRIPAELRIPGQPPLLYGPTFDYIATPTRLIEGIVREAAGGKPLAGVRLFAAYGYGDGVSTFSNTEGRYKLVGLPKTKDYNVYASPPKDGNLLSRMVRKPDDGGLGPVQINIELARGVVLTGRIIDKATGKGVQGALRFVPLPGNQFFKKPGYDSYRYESLMNSSEADGKFRLVVIPGSGVLMAQVHGSAVKIGGVPINPYKQADILDRKRVPVTETKDGDRYFTSAKGNIEFLNIEHACTVLDLDENTLPFACDLTVDPGKTLKVQVRDPDDKPLTGTIVSGMTATWPGTFSLKKAECTIYALDPNRPRQVVFFHPVRKLAAVMKMRGDEKEPPTVRLVPTGGVTGRVLDGDGQPVAGAEVQLGYASKEGRELDRRLQQQREPVRTDKDGRFRVDGVVSDLKFGLAFIKGKDYLVGEPKLGLKLVGSGKTLDLGEFRTKLYP
jgi:RNA polymerase sigma factor (sigma-70 family)